MIEIKRFVVNPLQENCYIVSDETLEACIIDPGCMTESEWTDIKSYINEHNLTLTHMLCTHLHFDHIMGCGFVYRDFGLDIEGSMADINLYNQKDMYLATFGLGGGKMPSLPPVKDITNSESIDCGNHKLRIIPTPGHSQGGVCFYCEEEKVLFAGDTMFQSSIGRTDLEGGNYDQLIHSITQKLMSLPPETKVLTGHGPATTIGYESRYNPYI